MLAQSALAYDFGRWAVIALVVCGILGIVYVGVKQSGYTPPPWVVQILGILACVIGCVLAVYVLMSIL